MCRRGRLIRWCGESLVMCSRLRITAAAIGGFGTKVWPEALVNCSKPSTRRLRACDVVRWTSRIAAACGLRKNIAAFAACQDMAVSPHCSIGPIAFAAAIHFAYSTPNMLLQESFAEFDVDWRDALACNIYQRLYAGYAANVMARAYSQDLRERVIDAALSGPSLRQAAARFNVGVSTVIGWVGRCATVGSTRRAGKAGHGA